MVYLINGAGRVSYSFGRKISSFHFILGTRKPLRANEGLALNIKKTLGKHCPQLKQKIYKTLKYSI